MPSRCCVPECKGNYDTNNEKVSIFKFPDEILAREKWRKAIPRKDFVPTKSSRVCEVHFKKDDIERDTWIYDSKTGEKLSAPLRHPRLKVDAVPSIFPGCPAYLSAVEPDREAPEDKRIRMEHEQLRLAIELSKESKEVDDRRFKFSTYTELLKCIENNATPKSWDIVRRHDKIIFLSILENCDVPTISASIVVFTTLEVKVFMGSKQLNSWNDVNLPKHIYCMKELSNLMEELYKVQVKHLEANVVLQLLETLLDKLDTSYPVTFVKEQLHLLQKKKEQRRYSPDLMIFSVLLHSISPHAYKFLRNSENIIIPHPTTLRRISSNQQTNPHSKVNLFKFYHSKLKYLVDNIKKV